MEKTTAERRLIRMALENDWRNEEETHKKRVAAWKKEQTVTQTKMDERQQLIQKQRREAHLILQQWDEGMADWKRIHEKWVQKRRNFMDKMSELNIQLDQRQVRITMNVEDSEKVTSLGIRTTAEVQKNTEPKGSSEEVRSQDTGVESPEPNVACEEVQTTTEPKPHSRDEGFQATKEISQPEISFSGIQTITNAEVQKNTEPEIQSSEAGLQVSEVSEVQKNTEPEIQSSEAGLQVSEVHYPKPKVASEEVQTTTEPKNDPRDEGFQVLEENSQPEMSFLGIQTDIEPKIIQSEETNEVQAALSSEKAHAEHDPAVGLGENTAKKDKDQPSTKTKKKKKKRKSLLYRLCRRVFCISFSDDDDDVEN